MSIVSLANDSPSNVYPIDAATPFDQRNRSEAPRRPGASTSPIVGRSAVFTSVLAQVDQVARTDATVLLLGETGTGKEVLATRLHASSARAGRPMVRVNCSALPSTLIESELFGRERGAFTDAVTRQIGRFEMADHSTIFLDEIGDRSRSRHRWPRPRPPA